MPQASRKGSFAVGEAGAILAKAFESETAISRIKRIVCDDSRYLVVKDYGSDELFLIISG
jgi:hypothetical protein